MVEKSEDPNFMFGNFFESLGQSRCFNFLGCFELEGFEKRSGSFG